MVRAGQLDFIHSGYAGRSAARLVMLLVFLGLSACQSVTVPDEPPATAQQIVHREGVPHTDAQGNLRRAYDPARSFFPIGAYHAQHGEAFGQKHDLALFKQAGFNTVHLWPVQNIDAALDAAERLGLQAIVENPDETLARRRWQSPAILAWMLENEAAQFVSDADTPARLAVFDQTLARFRSFDPGRASLIVDGAGLAPIYYQRWAAWREKADISALFNYPFFRRADPVQHIERVARTMSRAVRLTEGKKPVWYISQAFADTRMGWYMPDAEQLRATIYTALVHGATGVIHFSYDSHGTRDGDVLGYSPSPIADYGDVPDYDNSKKPALVATPQQLRQSQAMWRQVVALNHELALVGPSMLQPTADLACTVKADGPYRRSQPIRLIVKPADNGDLLLIAVNIEDMALNVDITCDRAIVTLAPFLPVAMPEMTLAEPNLIRDRFTPFGVRLYRLRLA